MENAILPLVSSQIYSHGNSEPVEDIPVMMDSKLNANGSCFSTYARVYNDCNQLRDGVFTISHPTPIKYQSGTGPYSTATLKRLDCPHLDTSHLITASGHGNILDQQQLSLFNKLPFPAQFQTDFQVTVTRKRSIEDGEKGYDNRGNVDLSEWRTNKKTLCFQEQWDSQIKEELKEIQRQGVQGRRSLKLSDKITALQKLVSPYGKTDTASVLHEACISIKALQDKIQKLFRSSSDSYTSTEPLNLQRYEEQQLDLQSRGFCLVPVSFTQKLVNEDQVGQRISAVIPRNM